ncbi:MAG: acyltransferase family protein [Propionibacteriaceae bacterium]
MTEQTAPDQPSIQATNEPTHLPPAARARLHWVDNLRVGLTILVIIHHCALTYGNIPLWFYNEVAQDPSGGLLDVVVVVNQTFFMGLFFFLSGLFVPRSIDRKGSGGFSRDRLIRLGLPLLGFLILLRPLAGLYGWLTTEDRPSFGLHYVLTWDPGPTWFLEVLLVFSLVYAVIIAVRPRADTETLLGEAAKPSGARVVGFLAGLALVIGAAMGLWMQLVPTGTYWPVVGLPTPSYLPQYAIMFALGIVVTRRDWLRVLPGWAGWIGAALFVVSVPLFGMSLLASGAGTTAANQLAEGLATGFAGVGLSVMWLVVFRRLFDHTGRLAAFLSANAFAVYVIHPVVLVWVAVLLSGLSTVAIAKFAALLIISVPACWLLAALLRKIPAVGRVM